MHPLDNQIAYITINPSGKFLKSAQMGFEAVGIKPRYLIHISPRDRLRKEFRWYKLGLIHRFLIPKIQQHLGNKKSFSEEQVDIEIPERIRTKSLNTEQTAAIIKRLGIKYLINCGAGIFRSKIINIENLSIINAHAGKLPAYKNMNVVEWAIFNQDPVIGTVHLINKGIDTGQILLQEELDLSAANDLESARENAFDQVIKLVGKTVLALDKGEIKPIPQTREGRNWYKMHSYFQKAVNQQLQQHTESVPSLKE